MSLFHRRHRSASATVRLPQSAPAPASGAAQSAAAQAFLASRRSSASLSTSAAAAALRSITPTPTPIDQIQTKRMIQRQSSTSSNSSHQGLLRRNSSGSMTERTFRSSSPGRPSSPSAMAAPPVPPVPRQYGSPSPLATKSDKRGPNLQPLPRVASPISKSPAGRGTSMDRSNAQPKQKPLAQGQSRLANFNELEGTDSRGSTNFSYPLNPRPDSPPLKQSALLQSRWAPDAHEFSASDREATIQAVVDTSQQPVKRKKKQVVRGSAEGSHLASGGMAVRTHVRLEDDVTQWGVKEAPRNPRRNDVVSGGEIEQQKYQGRSSDSDTTLEQIQERKANRAAGVLNKQPSIVREDWEGEQAGDEEIGSRSENALSPTTSPTSVGSKKPMSTADVSRIIDEPMDTITSHFPVESPTMPGLPDETTMGFGQDSQECLGIDGSGSQGPRQASTSPSRSTRFSTRLSSDLSAERKHEPLPRSVSPFKSAMKQYPPSPVSVSPVDAAHTGTWQRTSPTPSGASDTGSVVSADGLTPVPKKKKSVRIQFGDGPEVVGVSEPVENHTPAPTSPQSNDATRMGWFGKKTVALGTIPADDEMKEVMKPRPVLPSFGSVRGKAPNGDTRVSSVRTPVTLQSPSDISDTSTASGTGNTSFSSDHAISGILAQGTVRSKNGNQADPNLPLPPEVTSVEGTGYISDDSENNDDGEGEFQPQPEQPTTLLKDRRSLSSNDEHQTLSQPTSVVQQTERTPALESIPAIEVQPATPRAEDIKTQDELFVSVPGGFPSSSESLPDIDSKSATTSEALSPFGSYMIEPSCEKGTALQTSTTSGRGSLDDLRETARKDIDDDSSDHDSIYSDAEEDLSYLEGNSFGSINAIVESPIGPTASIAIKTARESPSVASGPDTKTTEPWHKTQAHWSDVVKRQKQQGTAPASPEVSTTAEQNAKIKPSTRTGGEEVAPGDVKSVGSPQSGPSQSSPYPIVAAWQDASRHKPMRKSMKAEPGPAPTATFHHSMRPPPKHSTQVPTTSAPPRATKLQGTLQKKYIPQAPATKAPAFDVSDLSVYHRRAMATHNKPAAKVESRQPKPGLQRKASNDSDSSSSFKKRKRREAKPEQVKYTMRRSMREPPPHSQASKSARRVGIRSLSPVNRQLFSPIGGQTTMRRTMRSSFDAGFDKSKSKRATVAMAPVSILKSRFADSDDDGEEAPRSFRSRFEDSSDDEPEPIKFRPVRGIPRKGDERDSTDLDDSSDAGKEEDTPRITEPVPVDVGYSPTSGKRAGFFRRFRSKKRDEVTTASLQTPASPPLVSAQAKAAEDKNSEAQSPKLQRRSTPQRIVSDSWPFPPKINVIDGRPMTADAQNMPNPLIAETDIRQGIPEQQNTFSTPKADGGTPIFGRSGRKKRFPKLRRAFGLYD